MIVGEALEIYATGLIEDGRIPPQVFIGGRMAEVLYFGNAPGYPMLNQVNVRDAGRNCSGACRPRALELSQPVEQ